MKCTYHNCWLDIDTFNFQGKTVQDFYDQYIPSKKQQHLLIQNKHILLDGQNVKRETVLNNGILSIKLYENDQHREVKNLKVIYEDELIIIINKPAGMIVHSDGTDNKNLSYFVNYYFNGVVAIHRLDKETSGLIVFSKSEVFQPLLDKMMSQKDIHRYYLAFSQGICPNKKEFIINDKIGKDRHNGNKMIVSENGMDALTKVQVVKTLTNKNITIFNCQLETGRTHQIRVHLSNKKYPIINDKLYGQSTSYCKNMGLVAYKIKMFHPLTNKEITVETNLPKDLDMLMKED